MCQNYSFLREGGLILSDYLFKWRQAKLDSLYKGWSLPPEPSISEFWAILGPGGRVPHWLTTFEIESGSTGLSKGSHFGYNYVGN